MTKNPNTTENNQQHSAAAAAGAVVASNAETAIVDADPSTNASETIASVSNSCLKVPSATATVTPTTIPTSTLMMTLESESQANTTTATSTTTPTTTSISRKPAPATSQVDSFAISELQPDLNCLLLADTTLDCAPLHLRLLLHHLESTQHLYTQAELLFLLIYIVALESGFCTQTEFNKYFYSDCTSDDMQLLPTTSTFHSKVVHDISRLGTPTYSHNDDKTLFNMQLRNFAFSLTASSTEEEEEEEEDDKKDGHCSDDDDDGDDILVFKTPLSAIITGDLMIVTFFPAKRLQSSHARGFSICLSIGRYVLSSQPLKGRPLYLRFRKLDELSMQLREKLFVPMHNAQVVYFASLYPSLLGLPAELYDAIFCYLSRNELNILANVNKELNLYVRSSKYYGR